MDHGYFRDRISGYLDSELPDYELEAVRQHLEECAECRSLYEQLRQVDKLVEEHAEFDSEAYWEQSAQRIEQRLGIADAPEVIEMPRKPGGGLGWKLMAVAASAAILVFIGVNYTDILRQDQGEQERPVMHPGAVEPDSAAAVNELAGIPETTTGRTGSDRDELAADADQPAIVQQQAPAEQRPSPAQQAPSQQKSELAPPAPQAVSPGPVQSAPDEARREARVVEEAEKIPEPILDKQVTPPVAEQERPEDRVQSRSDPLRSKEKLSLSPQSPRSAPRLPAASETESGPDRRQLSSAFSSGEVVVDSVSSYSLDDWRARRDSLATLWAELDSDHRELAVSKARGDRATLSDIELVERQLIEAYFRVADLSGASDSAASQEAVDFLQQYLDRPDARHRATARGYLDQLRPDTSGSK